MCFCVFGWILLSVDVSDSQIVDCPYSSSTGRCLKSPNYSITVIFRKESDLQTEGLADLSTPDIFHLILDKVIRSHRDPGSGPGPRLC